MFKFLRKYNKLLLAVFGVLLMITFLIPQAISRFGQQSGAGRATVATFGESEKVSGDAWFQVQREVQILQRLGVSLPGMVGNDQIKPEHWYLLTREAKEAGLIAAGASLDIPQESLLQLAMNSGERDLQFIRRTLAKTRGVAEMLDLYQTSSAFSDRRLKTAAQRMLGQVVAQIVVLEAKKNESFQPTEEEIAAQFAKYANDSPGGNPIATAETEADKSGFGYKLPDRVKLEWISIPVNSIREAVRQSEKFSSVAQRLHWKRAASDPATTFPPPDSGPVPEAVKENLLDRLLVEKAEEIAKFAASQLQLNRRGLAEIEGYISLPADWDQRKLAFSALADAIRTQFNIELPEYNSSGNQWTPVSDLTKLGPIATASTDKFGSGSLFVSQLVEQAREFRDETDPPSTVFIQKDIAGPPVKSLDGSVHVFRIIDADPSHSPTSVDEVRDAVVADLQRVADFKQLVENSTGIEQEAEQKGMLALAMSRDTIMQPSTTLSLSNRFMLSQFAQARRPPVLTPSNLPVVGEHRKTVEAVLDYAASLPADQAIANLDDLTEEQRVMAVPVEEKLALMVFRLVRVNPLTSEEYAELAQQGAIQQLAAADDSSNTDALKSAFGVDALVKRHNFAFARPRTEEPEQVSSAANAR